MPLEIWVNAAGLTADPDDAIRLIQNGLNKLGHKPSEIDGSWGVRTARASRELMAASVACAARPAALDHRGENGPRAQ